MLRWIVSAAVAAVVALVITVALPDDDLFVCALLGGSLAFVLFRKQSAPPELAKLEAGIAALAKSVEAFKHTEQDRWIRRSQDQVSFVPEAPTYAEDSPAENKRILAPNFRPLNQVERDNLLRRLQSADNVQTPAVEPQDRDRPLEKVTDADISARPRANIRPLKTLTS